MQNKTKIISYWIENLVKCDFIIAGAPTRKYFQIKRKSMHPLKVIIIVIYRLFTVDWLALTSSSSDCRINDRRYSIRAHFGHF